MEGLHQQWMQSGLNVHIHKTKNNTALKGFNPKCDIFVIEKSFIS